jgi:MazG family protein
MAAESGRFDIDDVCRGITEKLVRRHPHVFGDKRASNVDEALASWNEAKDKEQSDKRASRASALDGVPEGLPALGAALRTIEKAAAVRFDWPDAPAALSKLDEELAELRAAVARGQRAEIEDELGDVLFAAVAVGRKAGLDPELALRRAVGKFRRRFAVLERVLGDKLGTADLDELLAAWDRAVLAERVGPPTLP